MVALIFFIIQASLVSFYSYRLYKALKKTENPYLKYFFYGVLVLLLTEYICLVLTSTYLVTGQQRLLFWLDAVARFTLNLSSVFLIQIPLYFYKPKSKSRIYVSYLIFLLALLSFIYNLTLNYQPYLDAQGIVYWESPFVIIISSTLLFSVGWFTAAWVFLKEYLRSNYSSIKSLFLGLGFLLTGIGVIVQDYTQNSIVLYALYLSMIIGAVLVLFGFLKKDTEKPLRAKEQLAS